MMSDLGGLIDGGGEGRGVHRCIVGGCVTVGCVRCASVCLPGSGSGEKPGVFCGGVWRCS